SLKLRRTDLGMPRDGVIPRTQIRGLIEAHARPASSAVPPAGFRGLRSAASLKRPRRGVLPIILLVIPRTQIRGLIEAGPGLSCCRSGMRDSADSDPRPH